MKQNTSGTIRAIETRRMMQETFIVCMSRDKTDIRFNSKILKICKMHLINTISVHKSKELPNGNFFLVNVKFTGSRNRKFLLHFFL